MAGRFHHLGHSLTDLGQWGLTPDSTGGINRTNHEHETSPMLPADMEQFSHLRRAIAKSEALSEEMCPLALGVAEIDATLGGGLSRAALHEVSGTAPHLGAAAGFALTLAALASEQAKRTLWIAT